MLDVFVLDRQAILDRLGGDEEIYALMIDMFLQDVGNNCATLAAALASGDPRMLQREAHTLKGLLATFSDAAGAGHAFALEQKIKRGDLAGLDAEVELLDQRLHEVAGVLAQA